MPESLLLAHFAGFPACCARFPVFTVSSNAFISCIKRCFTYKCIPYNRLSWLLHYLIKARVCFVTIFPVFFYESHFSGSLGRQLTSRVLWNENYFYICVTSYIINYLKNGLL